MEMENINQGAIVYDFKAHRVSMKPEEETPDEKRIRDDALIRFRFEVEKFIIERRAEAETKLGTTY